MPSSEAPIVVLDSGLGGLTVVQALHRVLPQEQIVYFGDTARLPYGSKTAKVVTLYVRQIIQYLLPLNPKHVVIACNTASALALPAVQEEFSELQITGVVEPGARAAVSAASGAAPVIGVIGTEATVRSRAYVTAIGRHRPDAKVICRAAPLLVPIIEEGRTAADPLVRLCLQQYLGPILEEEPCALVLGCTHYPILRDLISQIAGRKVAVIDSADQCAEDVQLRLGSAGRLRDAGGAERDLAEMLRPAAMPPLEISPHPWLRCFVTDDSPRFATLASRFLGIVVRPPEVVLPDVLYANMNVVVASVVPT